MGTISTVSVLAGALCGLAALEVMMVIAGAVVVGINGSTSFATMGDGEFKTILGIILVAELFIAFMVGGYVSGRMSRRGGATHGVVAGMVGVILAAIGAVVVVQTGADNGLARVARHINVADTWHQWRYFGLIGILVAAAAIVLGGLAGGIKGERWHGKLLARAVDPSYGPEAEERAAARKRVTEAEVARLAAADHVGRLTGTAKAAQTYQTATPATRTEPAVAEPVVPVSANTANTANTADTATDGRSTRAMSRVTEPATEVTPSEVKSGPQHRRSHHLLGRN
jgi:MFS family permease